MWLIRLAEHGDSIYNVFLIAATVVGLPTLFFVTAEAVLFGRRKLFGVLALLCLGSMILLFGGQWLLAVSRLTWRNGIAQCFAFTMLFSGVGCALLAIRWIAGRAMPGLGQVARRAIKAAVVAAALLVSFYLLTIGVVWAIFTYSYGERVLEYQGQKLVEEKLVWLDVSYRYYEYHNPLIRGMDDIEFEQEPLEGG